MHSITELVKKKVVLLDGAMGTAMMARGLTPGAPGECWNLERPDDVRAIQAAYAAAGSDVIQTNTFGANRFRLEYHGLTDRLEEINQAAARLAREAAGEERLVAGNLGPSGVFLPPVGDGDPLAMEEAFACQAGILAKAGVDFISIETMIDLAEARIALKGARRGAPGLLVSVCMVFEKKKRGFFSPMGNRPEDAARTLTDEGADLVGANCSMGSGEMREMTLEFIAGAGVPVIMKPNAGLPELEGNRTVYRQEPRDFAADVMAMVGDGARAVGGCCGTDDRFIRVIREALDSLQGKADPWTTG